MENTITEIGITNIFLYVSFVIIFVIMVYLGVFSDKE
jgi:hypothetical protein